MNSMASEYVDCGWEYFTVGIYTVASRLSESDYVLSVYLVQKRKRQACY